MFTYVCWCRSYKSVLLSALPRCLSHWSVPQELLEKKSPDNVGQSRSYAIAFSFIFFPIYLTYMYLREISHGNIPFKEEVCFTDTITKCTISVLITKITIIYSEIIFLFNIWKIVCKFSSSKINMVIYL